LSPRSSLVIGSSWPGAPGTWVVYISPMYSAWSVTAQKSIGFLMLCCWPLTVTVSPFAKR
jgi:hypothetical protein